MELNGASIILECLKEQGVEDVFGYPGGAMLPLYDALYHYRNSFNHITTCHEQGASHAADGYARASGKVGVCFATSGPGATNTVTGIATAYMDSIPMVVFTGQVPSILLGKDSFQEIDITSITLPITKHNFIVRKVEDLSSTIRKAFAIAKRGRPGPVLIDLPKDVLNNVTTFHSEEITFQNKFDQYWDQESLEKAIKWIEEANKPVIYAGGGVMYSDSSKLLRKLATKGDIPVVNTLMGLGSFPRNHDLSLGMVGMHGLYPANMSVTDSDLIIAVGARFSDRVIGKVDEFAPRAKVIHIDIDRVEIGKNKDADLFLVGDIKNILSKIIEKTEEKARKAWKEKIDIWKEKNMDTNGFHPKNIIEKAWELTKGDAIVTTEVGQHQMWVAQYWKFLEPRTFLTSGGLGTMGYGLGAAIGAKQAKKEKTVLHFAGDGSFRMNFNELATVSQYNLPIITILFNNGTMGMVRQWQSAFYDKRYSQTDIYNNIDYNKLSEALGVRARKVEDIPSFTSALKEALDKKEAMVIECSILKDENVYPFVPAGKAINEMILN